MTHGSAGFATPTWSRGEADWNQLSKSRSASAGLRMRSPGPGSGTHLRPTHGPTLTEHSRSSCAGQLIRRARKIAIGLDNDPWSGFELKSSIEPSHPAHTLG